MEQDDRIRCACARASRRRLGAWLALACLVAGFSPAQAVVIVTGNGSGNTTPPTDDPGFANVGVTANGLTGIYLGKQWYLTASHVGQQAITLAGVTYPALPGSYVHLQHQPSPLIYADLAMVRIVGKPPLPDLVLASAPPPIDDPVNGTVTMIGHGWNREASQTCWNSSWAEVSCTPPPTYRGYKSLGTWTTTRWGRNLVSQLNLDSPYAGMVTRAFQTDFDNPSGPNDITHEAQAVTGDSGGAVFLKRNNQWQLVGVLFSILVFEGQPYQNVVAFDNATLSADVSYYRSQILAIMNPPPQIPLAPLPALLLGGALLAGMARLRLARGR